MIVNIIGVVLFALEMITALVIIINAVVVIKKMNIKDVK